jgi:tRNA (guanine-N7-)-methyltransferase
MPYGGKTVKPHDKSEQREPEQEGINERGGLENLVEIELVCLASQDRNYMHGNLLWKKSYRLRIIIAIIFSLPMKPKDLQRERTFDTEGPYLKDHVFYVPFCCDDYSRDALPPFREYFGNENPVYVEYCSGNGEWIVEKAVLFPDKNWIAVEKRFDRIRKIWSKLKNRQLANLLIVSGEAFIFTHHYLPDNSVEEVYINFPDPWPKSRHAKHRLIQPRFLDELARVLQTEKRMHVVTDDLPYLNQTLTLFGSHPCFSPSLPPPYYRLEFPGYGHSWFENLWKERGKQIHYTQFNKTPV